jgi:hypothetical protein
MNVQQELGLQAFRSPLFEPSRGDPKDLGDVL